MPRMLERTPAFFRCRIGPQRTVGSNRPRHLVGLSLGGCCHSLLIEFLPEPERDQHDKGTYEGGYDIPKRDRNFVEAGEQPEHSEQQTTNERTDKANCQVAEQTQAATFPGH